MRKVNLFWGLAIAATVLTGFTACSSDDNDEPVNNQVTDENVVEDDASALALVNGVYSHWQPLLGIRSKSSTTCSWVSYRRMRLLPQSKIH